MRIAFVNTLLELAKKNPSIMLMTADLGFSVFENFMQEMPDQYVNAGIAEQSMTGISAGLATEGLTPVIYSIVPFVTMRNFEQIRNDICYQNLNVKIVGVGAGFSYGPYGHTHHGLEDLAVLRSLPNMTIFTPGDPIETEFVTRKALHIKGPVYIRLGRAGEPVVYTDKRSFRVGKGEIVTEGKDVAILATSTMLYTAVQVSEILKKEGFKPTVVSIHTLKPFDSELVKELSLKNKYLYTIEEHFKIGGLGSAVAEVIAGEKNSLRKFGVYGVGDHFTKKIGDQNFMRRTNGLGDDQIARSILKDVEG